MRVHSNQDITDSQTSLERLNPPTANIRISKSRKLVNDTLTSNTLSTGDRAAGIVSNRFSARPEPNSRPSHPRPQTTKNATPRERKIIFLMHKRREIQLRRTTNSKWKASGAS